MIYGQPQIGYPPPVTSNMRVCNEPVRGGGNCMLEPGHRGYHSTVTFACDGCNKRRRGRPYRTVYEPDYETIALTFCFLCVVEDERRAIKMGAEY